MKAETAPAKLQPSSQTSAAASQWDADELQRKREELDKRAAELDRREQEMQHDAQLQGASLFVVDQHLVYCEIRLSAQVVCEIIMRIV